MKKIERRGSIIHWLSIIIESISYPSSSRNYFRWIVPVTCGSCGKQHQATVHDTNPAGGHLTADCLRSPQYEYTLLGFTGLCKSCLKRINKANTTYPDGTELFHRERTKYGMPVHCGACSKKGFLTCALSETLHDKHWPCPICGEVLGKWLHKESGATVYWLKRQEGQRNYVEYDCAKCNLPFYCKDELPVRAEWWGLCSEDRYKFHPQRTADKKSLPGLDKAIDYGEDRFGEGKPKTGKKRPSQGNYVRVPCPLPGYGKVNTFHFQTTRKEDFTGLCKPGKGGHRRDEIALFFLRQPQNSHGQKNGSPEKRTVGRPKKEQIDHGLNIEDQKLKARFEEIVRSLRIKLPPNKIRRKAIVDEYHAAGEPLDPTTVTKRVQLFYGKRISVEDAVSLVPDNA